MSRYLERAETPRAAFDFLAFDRERPCSILQCLRAARENARAVRGTITSDVWETLNTTYLKSQSFNSSMPESGRGERLLAEASEWAVLLRAMSAFEIYRRVCRDSITPQRVTEMLLTRADLPQAVHRCLDELQANLTAVANDQSAETLRRLAELHHEFHDGRFEQLCAGGIPVFLDRVQGRLRDVGARIANDFLASSVAQ